MLTKDASTHANSVSDMQRQNCKVGCTLDSLWCRFPAREALPQVLRVMVSNEEGGVYDQKDGHP